MENRKATDLLDMRDKSLQSVAVNSLPKSLEPFWDKDLSVAVNLVENRRKKF